MEEDAADVSSTIAEASTAMEVEDLSSMIEVVSLVDDAPSRTSVAVDPKSRKRRRKRQQQQSQQQLQYQEALFQQQALGAYAFHAAGACCFNPLYPLAMHCGPQQQLMPQPIQQPSFQLEPLEQLASLYATNSSGTHSDECWWNNFELAYYLVKKNGPFRLDRRAGTKQALGKWANDNRKSFSTLKPWKKKLLKAIAFEL